MNSTTNRYSGGFLLFLAGLAVQGIVLAAEPAVSRISVTEAAIGSDAEITLLFACAHQLLDQSPQGDADRFQVTLRQLGGCRLAQLPQGREGIRTPAGSSAVHLDSVEYEHRLDGESVLHLRFDRAVIATASQGGDSNQLTLTVDFVEPVLSIGAAPAAEQTASTPTVSGEGAAVGDRPLSESRLNSLMGEGEAAILNEDYDRAIQVYTRVLRAPENPLTPNALERLGLARERNGQTAHAVNEYRRYLELYPDNEGADRVAQRLNGLVTAHKTDDSPGSGGTAVAAAERNNWDVYGGIQQYYRHDTINPDGQSSINAQSSILTNADLVLRRQGERIDFSGRFTLGNLWDLLGGDKGPGSQTRFYQGHLEVNDRVTGLSGTVGRQTLRSSGVLGRFDGMHVAWEFRPGMRLNVVGGYPVISTDEGIETERTFYGAAVDFEEIADRLDVSVFYNTQEIDGLDNREAIGTEIRYLDDTKSLIALIDYDIGFNRLNNFTVTGNWNMREGTSLSGSVNHRTSPYLTTRNALIGQTSNSIEELLLEYTEDEIFQLAEDRTGEVTSFRLGLSQSLTERWQLNADVTVTDFKGTTESGGVLEIPDMDTQYYYSLNLVGTGLFMENDSSIFGVRHIDGASAGTSTLYWDARFPLSQKLRLNPRLRFAYRDLKLQDSNSWTALPSIRLLYRFGRNFRLDFEVGGEWTEFGSGSTIGDRSSWFIYAGYRADF